MSDKNNTLITLSRFAKLVRPYLGQVDMARMLESKAYATELVLRAFRTEKPVVASLANELMTVLALDVPMILSVRRYYAYLKLLQRQALCEVYWPHMIDFVDLLEDCAPTSDAYRAKVDMLLQSRSEAQHSVCLDMVRDFYPFWFQNYSDDEEQTIQRLKVPLHQDTDDNPLIAIWNHMHQDYLTPAEQGLMAPYVAGLRSLGLMTDALAIRVKIASFLLILLREKPVKSGQSYRKASDMIYSLVTADDLKGFIFEVCREFYPFWMHEGSAVDQLHASMAMKAVKL